jgi:putative transposase
LSNDPAFVEKACDITGLYLDPPDHAALLCVDWKSQIQVLARTHPCCRWYWAPSKVLLTTTFVGRTAPVAARDVANGQVPGAATR